MEFSTGGKKEVKAAPERRPGDWFCSECGQLNFKSRDKCFRGCPVFRPSEISSQGGGGAWRPHDQVWRERDRERGFSNLSSDPWGRPTKGADRERRPGDWICPRCKVLNYTSRQQCFKCELKKPANMENENPVHGFGRENENSGHGFGDSSKYFCPNCPCLNCNRSSGLGRSFPSFQDPYPRGALGGFPGYGGFSGGDRRPGDWDCPSCRGHNYADKKACFKCGVDKPQGIQEMGSGMPFSSGNSRGDWRPGDWDCPSCNAHNFASKTACFVCSKPKPKDLGKSGLFGNYGGNRGNRRPGDWDCPECQAHNYADKIACFKCKVIKPEEF